MNEFKTYHPIVNFVYFLFVIGFSCFFMHPVCLGISLVSGFTYAVVLKGKKALKTNLLYILPMIFFMAIMNPMFNHAGITVITYLPSGNPLTMESILYGICAAFMISSVICHFYCYNEIMTSDKFIYLFGKLIPAMSLIISMILRFVPEYSKQLKEVVNARRCIDRGGNGIADRIKNALKILSVMTTRVLENSIETADSMKARGYGISGRTAFSNYRFDKRDAKAICIMFVAIAYIVTGSILGEMKLDFFPSVSVGRITLYGASVFVAYFIFCIYPVIIEIREAVRWKLLKSKI